MSQDDHGYGDDADYPPEEQDPFAVCQCGIVIGCHTNEDRDPTTGECIRLPMDGPDVLLADGTTLEFKFRWGRAYRRSDQDPDPTQEED